MAQAVESAFRFIYRSLFLAEAQAYFTLSRSSTPLAAQSVLFPFPLQLRIPPPLWIATFGFRMWITQKTNEKNVAGIFEAPQSVKQCVIEVAIFSAVGQTRFRLGEGAAAARVQPKKSVCAATNSAASGPNSKNRLQNQGSNVGRTRDQLANADIPCCLCLLLVSWALLRISIFVLDF